MTRLATNVGFTLIFLTAGAIVGWVLFWITLIAFALVYNLVQGHPYHFGSGLLFEKTRVAVIIGTSIGLTVWLFRKKRRTERRWGSGSYLRCLKCGYDLRGNQANTCPECGFALTRDQQYALEDQHA